MKKRLVSVGLCALMLTPAIALLSSCGNTDVTETQEVVKPLTLTLNMITDGRTTREGIAAVQEAINLITENDLNIHVVLEMYTKDTYVATIKDKLAKLEDAKMAGQVLSSVGNEEDQRLIEIVPGKYRTVTDYPKPYDNQLDIFVIAGYDMLNAFSDNYIQLYDPSADMTDTAALTSKYISSRLMSYGLVDGTQVVIPGNSYYGNYEYLLLKKSYFDDAPFALGDMTGLASLGDYLSYVGTNNADVTPLYNVGSLGLISITDTDSVVSAYVPDGTEESAPQMFPANIMKNADVKAQVKSILAAGISNGKFAKNEKSIDPALLSDPDAKFAAAFIQGTADLPENEEITKDYYVIKTRNPVADQDEVFSSMFAVTNYSSDTTRCMQLVNRIMTDEVLLNTLLYGVENVTYTRDELTKIVSRNYTPDPTADTNAIYIMDEKLIGNTFLAWQNTDMTEEELKVSANGWELAKRASTDATISPYARFVPEWSDKLTQYTEITKDYYEELWAKLPEYSFRINNATGEPYTLDEYCDYLGSWLALLPEVNFMANASYTVRPGDTDTSLPFATQYREWWQAKYASGDE